MATKLALSMTASLSAAGLRSGADEGAAALAKLGNASQATFEKLNQFGGGNAAAAAAASQLATDFGFLSSAFRTGQITAAQYADELAKLNDAAGEQTSAFGEGQAMTARFATEHEKAAAQIANVEKLLGMGAISQTTYNRAMAEFSGQNASFAAASKAAAKAESERAAVMSRGETLTRSVETETERYDRTMADLNAMLKAGAITQETFNRAAAKAAGDITKAGVAAEQTENKMHGLTTAVRTIAAIEIGRVFASAARSIIGAGQSAVAYAQNVANAVDATNDLSKRVGIGVEQLQGLQMAAKLAGVGDATMAFQKLAVAIGKAGESDKAQETFARLGVNFAELQAMEPEEQFKTISAAIAKLPTEAERAAAAVAMFGKAGVTLLPLMGENLDEVNAKMRRLGGVVSEDQTNAIATMNDQLDWTKAAFDGIVGQVVGNLAPAVTSLVDDMLSFVEAYESASGVSGGSGIADTITQALFDGADWLGETFDWGVNQLFEFADGFASAIAVMEGVAQTFEFVGQLLYGGFKLFEIVGNLLTAGFGKLLEGLGSWVSSDLEAAGKELAAQGVAAAKANAAAIDRIGMGDEVAGPVTTGRRAAAAARSAYESRNDPERQAKRDAARAERDARVAADRQAAEQERLDKQIADARAANEKALADARKRDENQQRKRGDDIAKAEDRVTQAGSFRVEAQNVLSRSASEALNAADIRSSEGISQFLGLASGREDPAIEEYRKQYGELVGIRAELVALRAEPVSIIGPGAGGV